MPGRLSELQDRVLAVLAGMEPRWTLTGGAALVGFHTLHRTTRDLDLFWHGPRALGPELRLVEDRLVQAGFSVTRLQTAPSFVRLRASAGGESVLVDLVADPVPPVEAAIERAPGVFVDTAHELLVNKLTALLSRSEVRDLEDVRVLLETGGDLGRALADAPRKDGGFSPLTLAWSLEQLPLVAAADQGFEPGRLAAFRERLVAELVARRD